VNSPLKQYVVPWSSDNASLTLDIDCSLAPVHEDFSGNLPVGVVLPAITGPGITGNLANVTCQLNGQIVHFTFPAPLPQLDTNGNLIVYLATFTLQYGD
jgi:hypothetical protein